MLLAVSGTNESTTRRMIQPTGIEQSGCTRSSDKTPCCLGLYGVASKAPRDSYEFANRGESAQERGYLPPGYRVCVLGGTFRRLPPSAHARSGYFLPLSPESSVDNAATNASCGTSTRPMVFIRFLPSFCFSSSLRLRVMSPP